MPNTGKHFCPFRTTAVAEFSWRSALARMTNIKINAEGTPALAGWGYAALSMVRPQVTLVGVLKQQVEVKS
ncbi:hypothetical protein K239x_30020 [Planctomycetes bacterium K23_9]|uniref:Uncharacterized protein n=1 Tax=Stieleria marina TaxID=1930275 RepID=A0A517NV61_9BACT|nr:hypothetical protein K239x_30020 [Planctomycetes bacterium K23_9]